jgi:uncharacterized protein involved in type VI secretion and phage assembly
MSEPKKYYGKYRGMVINNIDPEQRGRLLVSVPDVSGDLPTTWAMACVPITGKGSGIYVVPQVGTGVWVEFEQGDPDHPIWVGGFWGSSSEVPSPALSGNPASPSIVLQTGLSNAIIISDLAGPTGGIKLQAATGAMILVCDTGITLDNGKGATIALNGSTVDFNNGAMQIT